MGEKERTEESRRHSSPTDWFLMRGNRLLVTGLLSVSLFGGFVLAARLLSPSFTQQVAASDPVETLFAAMITVIVTGTTLVVSIGQLVLTQENGPLGDQQERMRNSMAVRAEISQVVGRPTPEDPAEFLGVLLDTTVQRSRALGDSLEQSTDPTVRSDGTAFAEQVAGNAAAVRDRIGGAQFGTFDVLSGALQFDYGSKVAEIERFTDEAGDRLTADQRGLFEELEEVLLLFGPAREHIKTLYFQWALIGLSQLILYAAIPAVAVAAVMIATFDVGTVAGSTLGVAHTTVVVGAAFALTLLPFVLFVSYILRILTVAKRTLAIEPLELRQPE